MTSVQAPSLAVDTWLTAVLGDDAELEALAPGGVFGRGYTMQAIVRIQPSWPAVVFGVRPGGKETYNLDGSFSFAQIRYAIEAIDKSSDETGAFAAAARIHSLITNTGSDRSGNIMRCFRLQVIDRAEVADGGAQFQHAGGVYEVWVQG